MLINKSKIKVLFCILITQSVKTIETYEKENNYNSTNLNLTTGKKLIESSPILLAKDEELSSSNFSFNSEQISRIASEFLLCLK